MFSKIRLVLAFPSRIPEVLGTALTSSSNFFINFVIIQARSTRLAAHVNATLSKGPDCVVSAC